VKARLIIEPSRMTFSIVKAESNIARVALCGGLEVSMIGVFRRELANLLRIRPACVQIDMSRLRFIDKAGVDLLLSFFTDLSRQGAEIVILGLRAQPLESFQATLLEEARATPVPVN
jgi:anti-anti-sigma regulatory factor